MNAARMSEWRRRNPERAKAASRRWDAQRKAKEAADRKLLPRHAPHARRMLAGAHVHRCIGCKESYDCVNACDPVDGLNNSLCNPCFAEFA